MKSNTCHRCGEPAAGFYCDGCRRVINRNRRARKLIRFRNCFCGQQAEHHLDGSFLCAKHFEMDRRRLFQDPSVTAENIRRSNIESERRRYGRLKAAGVCVTCAKAPSYTGCVRCHECQEKRRAVNARYKGRRLDPLPQHPWRAANKTLFA